jgi:hypothetical protein
VKPPDGLCLTRLRQCQSLKIQEGTFCNTRRDVLLLLRRDVLLVYIQRSVFTSSVPSWNFEDSRKAHIAKHTYLAGNEACGCGSMLVLMPCSDFSPRRRLPAEFGEVSADAVCACTCPSCESRMQTCAVNSRAHVHVRCAHEQ